LLAPRLDLNDVLKSGAMSLAGGRNAWVRSVLVVSQVALALVLLLGSGLLLRSLQTVLSVDLGFRTGNLVMAGMRLAGPNYRGDEAKAAFLERVLERASALPGVESAAIANSPPMTGYTLMTSAMPGYALTASGEAAPSSSDPGRGINIPVVAATPEYFRTLGVRLLRGRLFTAADHAGTPQVVVVSARFADRVLPGVDPIGRQVKYLSNITATIVGVVSDVRHDGRERGASAELIVPEWQHPSPVATLLVRTRGNPESVERAIRPAVWSVDKDMAIFDLSTMDERLARRGASRRMQTALLSAFGLLALLLSAVGIYGVASEAVGQRTREIGLRMALGARAAQVVGMVMRRSGVLAGVGVAIGSAAGVFLSRYVAGLLFGVKPTDGVTFAVSAVVLLGVALVAGYVPARRAARIDPVAALRCE
jgi:putative ABC transport system permease protein